MNFEWLSGIDALLGTWLVIGIYVALLVLVLACKSEVLYAGAPDRSRWRDLRLWAVPIVLLQIWLYWLMR